MSLLKKVKIFIRKKLKHMTKKKQIFKYTLLFFATVLSVAIFISIYESISYLKYQNGNKVEVLDTKEISSSIPVQQNSKNPLDKHKAYIECMEKGDIMTVNCDNATPITEPIATSKVEREIKNNDYQPFKDLLKSNIVIKLIYLFLTLTLVQQTYLFLLSKFDYFLDVFDFHKSEWAINVAPMFGLLGTFFSMAILLNGNNENIDTALIKNFFDAVMTTMIGIIFYIINFYLKVSIYPKITEQKND